MRLLNAKKLNLKDADVIYYPNFFSEKEADFFFKNLKVEINWLQDKIKVFGKTYDQPRLTSFFATNKEPYSYSNITMYPRPFDGNILKIKTVIETELSIYFTSCLANLYRDGKDSNGWHADDEKSLGKKPVIASATFGEERPFHFKHKKDKSLKEKITLKHGSVLLMQGSTQENWLHQIPKTTRQIGSRINLTFRIIPQKNRVPSNPVLS
ncbi:alpha-ketoglutarate-dependent dioxygenase AlkB family protein [Hyunsoonleella pacifica]|uniref:Alpha-ketoglutarate-dependent dioxygenase AlkB n=1 Tax=Hyunsoonleella pacifica TaxID=1080224 RepID=A0A4Q9FUW0_9FLAO|nr:alpha-ketoglutarate-dependent dioxygenase AlkB [Hyunsoonleella pacifica]TBN18495.1 alpha-ketoglutarate-dependent dioxygenase AlkB [Hyunsoonleella pacifica]GGD02220.1 alkylated DNA repair protein [Hyunsoonleella pacifica]